MSHALCTYRSGFLLTPNPFSAGAFGWYFAINAWSRVSIVAEKPPSNHIYTYTRHMCVVASAYVSECGCGRV